MRTKVNERISLTKEEKALIETIEELPRDKHGEILIKTITKQFAIKMGRKYTGRKIVKLLDEIGKKILISLDCGFAIRVERHEGVCLWVSVVALHEARRLMEDD